MEALYRDYLPKDIIPELKDHQINGTVLIQAASTIQETDYMLELYRQEDFISGVVGWLDLDSSDFPKEFKQMKQKQGIVGIRPIIDSVEIQLAEENLQIMKNIELLVKNDFPIDLLVRPHQLPLIINVLKRFPELRGVVNHAAKPNIREQFLQPWKDDMEKIAAFPNTMCKLSGLITEASRTWTSEDIQPVVDHVVAVFGYDAVMFGSDWPVCNDAGSYAEVYDVLCKTLPEEITEAEKEKIFGLNAVRFYKKLRIAE